MLPVVEQICPRVFHGTDGSLAGFSGGVTTRPRLRVGHSPEHLSVYQTSPELWEREAFKEKLDGAPEATGKPRKSSAGELGRLAVRAFFSAGAGLLAWSHMPVETAQ